MKNFALLLVTLMLCIFVMTGCSQKGITTQEFDKDPQRMLEESIDYQQIFGIDNAVVKAINGENTKASDSAKLTLGIDLAEIVGDATLPALDVTVADSKGKTDIDLDLDFGGFAADARLYIDQDMLVLESDAFLGGAYSVKFEDLSTFVEKFDNSELAKALYLPEGTAAAFCGQYGINDEYIAGIKAEWEKIANSQNFDFTSRIKQATKLEFTPAVEETVDINGVQTEVITSTSSVDEEMYANIISEYFAFSEELIVAVKNLVNAVLPEPLKQQAGIDIDTEFDSVAEQYNASMQDMMGDMVMEGNVKYYLEKATGKLLKMDYNYDYQMAGVPVTYLLTADLTDGFKMNGTLITEGQTIDMDMDIVHAEQENSQSWTMNITQGLSGEEPISTQMALTLNKAEDSYKLTITADGEEMAVNGTYKCEKDSFKLTIDTLEFMGESVQLGISLGYSENIEITAPQHKELLTLTKQEVYALVGKISTLGMSAPAVYGE